MIVKFIIWIQQSNGSECYNKSVLSAEFGKVYILRFDSFEGVIVGCLTDVAVLLLSGYCFDDCGMQDVLSAVVILLLSIYCYTILYAIYSTCFFTFIFLTIVMCCSVVTIMISLFIINGLNRCWLNTKRWLFNVN